MKKIEVLLSMLIILAFGYSDVKFEESQPRELSHLEEFPEDLVGSYISVEGETTIVAKDKLETPLFSVDLRNLSQEVHLKRYKDYLFLNAREKNGWEVMIIEKKSSEMIQVKTIGELTDAESSYLSEITPIKNIEQHFLAINPDIHDLEKLIDDDFFDEVTRMKKLVV